MSVRLYRLDGTAEVVALGRKVYRSGDEIVVSDGLYVISSHPLTEYHPRVDLDAGYPEDWTGLPAPRAATSHNHATEEGRR